MTRKRGAITAAIGVVAAALFLVPQVIPLSTETCITAYEDASGGGDHISFCDTTAGDVKVANLGNYTTGLVNGCNRAINQSSSWADCISSIRVGNLPGSTKLVVYQNTNYAVQTLCRDTNGSYLVQLTTSATNDNASSFRILGGNC